MEDSAWGYSKNFYEENGFDLIPKNIWTLLKKNEKKVDKCSLFKIIRYIYYRNKQKTMGSN
jgi:hypothetical protein